jgi:hypothetical protein
MLCSLQNDESPSVIFQLRVPELNDMKIIDSQRNVRASLTKPVKSGTEKHEFGAPNSYLRAEKWQAQNRARNENRITAGSVLRLGLPNP